MKSKFGIFLIALLGYAFTGFGQTTADPPDNSTAIAPDKGATVNVAMSTPVMVSQSFVMVDGIELEVKRYQSADCEYVSFAKAEAAHSLIVDNSPDATLSNGLASNDTEFKKRIATEAAFIPNRPYRAPRDGFNYSQR